MKITMKSSEKATLQFFFLYIGIASQVIEITCIKVQTISHTLPFATKLIQDTRDQPSSRLVYGVCDTKMMVYERNCTLVVETNAPYDSLDHLSFCDITIRSRNVPMNIVNYVYALDENTIAVQWTNRYNSRFAIVHFSDCRVVYPRINEDSKISLDLICVPYNGIFDVIVQDNRKGSSCQRDNWCRMVFDVNGYVVEQPHNWIDEYNDIIDVVHTADGRRLVVDMNYNRSKTYVRVYKAYNGGEVKIFMEYPAGNLHASSSKVTVSSTYQLLTVCALNHSNMTCGQFDHHGVLKIQTNFRPLNFSDLHSAKVFNLPDGGFVLLTVNCSSSKYNNDCLSGNEQFFSIRIFDPLTRILKSLSIAQLKCYDEFNLDNIHFVENRNKSICLSYVCDHRETDGRVSVEVNCFTKFDLTG